MNREWIQKFVGMDSISIVKAMEKIDLNTRGILFIVNKSNKLIGCLTDGDIRRWIIKTGNLNSTAFQAMNPNPVYLYEEDMSYIHKLMDEKKIDCIPIVNIQNQIVDIVFSNSNDIKQEKETNTALANTPVIIMAGGKGTRLYPYTRILPKPLIPIGDIPILERILKQFHQFGANDFYLTVNYKKEMIKSYFHELKPEYRLHYVDEQQPLGTAGGIKLIKKEFDKPIFITNCDILIQADYKKILDYHIHSGNIMTIISSLKNTTIPYGVIHTQEKGVITSMEEKPIMSFFINTGMYVIMPDCIEQIPKNSFFHMTDLVNKLMSQGKQIGMYPISENSFLDMGQFEEMKKMEEKINGGAIVL